MPNYQGVWSLSTQYQNAGGWPLSPLKGDIGLIAGGIASGQTGGTTGITYITISTSGSDAEFGDLSGNANFCTGLASSTRAVFMRGNFGATTTANFIEFVGVVNQGNTKDFGDFAVMSGRDTAATSNGTRGLFMGQTGSTTGSSNAQDTIAYITIASTGNAQDFGNLTRGASDGTNGRNAACASTTRAILGGGGASTPESNILDYVTISSTGNATDFGDLTVGMNRNASCSSSTRGVWAAGLSSGNYNNTINYVTMASTGNATDFGDMTLKTFAAANGNLSNKTYGMFAAGNSDSADYIQQISYITIASTGNSSDFGDVALGRDKAGAASNSHGGLS
tara:strand:+ start:1570 stop:2580 length:1011 start_codon:yes stop_codon:yes gene_type:complete